MDFFPHSLAFRKRKSIINLEKKNAPFWSIYFCYIYTFTSRQNYILIDILNAFNAFVDYWDEKRKHIHEKLVCDSGDTFSMGQYIVVSYKTVYETEKKWRRKKKCACDSLLWAQLNLLLQLLRTLLKIVYIWIRNEAILHKSCGSNLFVMSS